MKYLKQLIVAGLVLAAPNASSAQGRGGPPGGLPGAFGAGPPGLGMGPPGMGVGRIGPPGPIGPPSIPGRPLVPPGLEVRSAVQSLERDLVGRPNDNRIVTAVITRDNLGTMIVRGEILAVSPNDQSLAIARRLNFTVARQDKLDELGITSVTLRAPAGMSETEALTALRQADPDGTYDYAHIYNPTGDSSIQPGPAFPSTATQGAGIRIGMVDGGIGKDHHALKDATISSRTFADGDNGPPTLHGTAIASLLIGKDRGFSGYLPGATLYAADVFGGAADGGSAENIARALNWLASNRIPVTNISLAGPPNALLAAAVKGFVGTGHVLVAPVGNDGPAASPNFPAAYPGVVAVTSVDANKHIQADANRGTAMFAAPGVNVQAAILPQGYANVTGTSYAAPTVTANFALKVSAPSASASKSALSELEQTAMPLSAAAQAVRYLPPPAGM